MIRGRRVVLATLAVVPVLLLAGPASAESSHPGTHAAVRNATCGPGPALGSVFLAYPLERTPLQSAERPGQALQPGHFLGLPATRSPGRPSHEAMPARVTPFAGCQAGRGPPALS